MLAQLCQRYPGLDREIALSNASADLLGQEADIAVRMHRPQQGALVARYIGAIPLQFFAHGEYIAKHGMPERPEALADHALIGPGRAGTELASVASSGMGLSRRSLPSRAAGHSSAPACLPAASRARAVEGQKESGRVDQGGQQSLKK